MQVHEMLTDLTSHPILTVLREKVQAELLAAIRSCG